MKTSRIFTPTQDEIDRLIADQPMALLVSTGQDGFSATPLPLLLERHADGSATLLGHFARANPQVEELERRPDALIVFSGPHGYISPSWFTDRSQAPTWNYAHVHMQVRVDIDRSLEAAREAVDVLTERMEAGRPDRWTGSELGERYDRLLPAVVAFRAAVLSTSAKFKLGQNERLDVLSEALVGLGAEDTADLATMMERANAERLSSHRLEQV